VQVVDVPIVRLRTPRTGIGTALSQHSSTLHTTGAGAVFADDATAAGALGLHPCDVITRNHSTIVTGTRLGDDTAKVHGTLDRLPDHHQDPTSTTVGAASQVARTLRRVHPKSRRSR